MAANTNSMVDKTTEETQKNIHSSGAPILYSAAAGLAQDYKTNIPVQQPLGAAAIPPKMPNGAAKPSAAIPTATATGGSLSNTQTIETATSPAINSTIKKVADSKYYTHAEIRELIRNRISKLLTTGVNELNSELTLQRVGNYVPYTCLSWAVNNDYDLAIELMDMGANLNGDLNVTVLDDESSTPPCGVYYIEPDGAIYLHKVSIAHNPLYVTMYPCGAQLPHVTTENERANLARLLIQRGADITKLFNSTSSVTFHFPRTLFTVLMNQNSHSEPQKVLLAALFQKAWIDKDKQALDLLSKKIRSLSSSNIAPLRMFTDEVITRLKQFGQEYYNAGILKVSANMEASNAASDSAKLKAGSGGLPALK